MDLDETLVHSSFNGSKDDIDFSLKISVQGSDFLINVKKRPGCELFIKKMSEYYEVIIWTASLSEYANPTVD